MLAKQKTLCYNKKANHVFLFMEAFVLHDFSHDKFDIIIQAGQSNSEGYGFGLTDEPYQPNDRVWYLNQDRTISLAVERVRNNGIQSNFALSFAREYISTGKLAEGRKFLIIRAAVGGTGFLDNRWKLTDDLYLQMMDMTRTALELNPENRLVALLWHQGETDAICNATYEQHYDHLMTLLKSVRTEFNVPSLPFVAGDFVHHWRDIHTDTCTPVINAIRDVCVNCGYGRFVETEGLNSNAQDNDVHPLGWVKDYIHFSRRSIYELGKRYFEAFCSIAN